jgi:hypothetical protein
MTTVLGDVLIALLEFSLVGFASGFHGNIRASRRWIVRTVYRSASPCD